MGIRFEFSPNDDLQWPTVIPVKGLGHIGISVSEEVFNALPRERRENIIQVATKGFAFTNFPIDR